MRKVVVSLFLLLPLLAFAQPPLPGYTALGYYGGHTYYVSSGIQEWAQANVNCVFVGGGNLASVTSAGEQAFLNSTVPNGSFWLGGLDAGIEGTWEWILGETWSYTNWGFLQPSGVGESADFLVMAVSGGSSEWNDWFGTWSYRWILEVPTGLPVEMTSFNASSSDGVVSLRWHTESETENSHFNLYRSTAEGDRGELLTRIDGHGTTAHANDYIYSDTRVVNGVTYYYRIADVSFDGIETLARFVANATPAPHALGEVPFSYNLSQNFPNPFNPATEITYGIHEAGNVRLTVFNELGKEVATLVNSYQAANTYRVSFNAAGLPSGTYYYTLSTNGFTTTKKMVLTK